jgi:hypothetical protein
MMSLDKVQIDIRGVLEAAFSRASSKLGVIGGPIALEL